VPSKVSYGIAIELFAFALWVVQQMIGVIPPPLGWSVIIGCVIAGIVLIIQGKQEENDKQRQESVRQETTSIKPQEGSLDTVTSEDRRLIMSMAMDMLLTHGHMDLTGLLADRASGVPLNELMTRNCSESGCGIPRNQRVKRRENEL
jgi:hypothetical protein